MSKNSLFQFIDELKSQVVKPKVYSMVLRCGTVQYLTLQAAFNLEDAFAFARLSFQKDNPNVNISAGLTMEMFVQSEMFPLFDNFLSTKVKKEEGDKNLLMKQIIEEKNLLLFKENKELFTANEQKYLMTEIRK